jgi:hypothetical protein
VQRPEIDPMSFFRQLIPKPNQLPLGTATAESGDDKKDSHRD